MEPWRTQPVMQVRCGAVRLIIFFHRGCKVCHLGLTLLSGLMPHHLNIALPAAAIAQLGIGGGLNVWLSGTFEN